MLETLRHDLIQALRSLRRAPGFALLAAGVMGLGVGAATTVFSVMNPLIFAPLPFEDPEALVWIANVPRPGEQSLSDVSSRSGNLRDFRESSRSFSGLTGFHAFFDQTAYTLTGGGEPERIVGAGVAHDFLNVLGVQPLLGRAFSAEEGLWGGPGAVILSYGFWRSRYGGDPEIVGGRISLNDEPRTVVGVLPPTFDFSSLFTPGLEVHFLLPFPVSEETDRDGNTMAILGRLRPDVTPAVAQAELGGLIASLKEEQPDRWGLAARITPLQEQIAGPFRSALLLLGGAAGTLLLIVVVNLSNLLLARLPSRAREIAVRKALGASRGSLIQQLLLEMAGISLMGMAFGSGLAWAATHWIASATALQVPMLDQVKLEMGTLLFGIALTLLVGLLISVLPALRVGEGDESTVLRSGNRGGAGGRGGRRLREALVVTEVGLVCVLLVVGGLLVRSFRAVVHTELGYAPENALAWQLNPTEEFESIREETGFYTPLAKRVADLPGIQAAGLIDALPLGRNRSWPLWVVGRPEEEIGRTSFSPHIIDAGYLAAMRIPLLAGRGFSLEDTEDSPRVILVNESGAKQAFDGEEPLGQRIALRRGQEWRVVGIVGDVRHLSPEVDPGIQVYFPLPQIGGAQTMDLVVRSDLPDEGVAAVVSAALREFDPSMPTRESWSLQSTVDRAVSPRSFTLAVLLSYGLAALLLAALGIYGVIAQSVAERTTEIGTRRALGASRAGVIRSVLGRTLVLTGIGILIGCIGSIAASRFLGSLLFGISSMDPATYVGMALVLLVIAALAGLIPAVRAARTRGIRALQTQ